MTRLAGAAVWVTGASSGIGEALALQASATCARLLLTARRTAELERVRSLCVDPARVSLLPLDLTDFDADAAAAEAERLCGPIDILVNNAGLSQRSALVDTDMAVYRRLMELDFFAPVALTKAVLPTMRRRGYGHVIMVGSVVSRIGAPMRTGYSADKHALAGFTEAARAELWREGIRFTLVGPGYVKTQVSVNALTGSGQRYGIMDPSTKDGLSSARCAAAIWKAMEAGREEAFIGREAAAVELKRLLPGPFSFVLKRVRKTGARSPSGT